MVLQLTAAEVAELTGADPAAIRAQIRALADAGRPE
jgi:hypothetical protein